MRKLSKETRKQIRDFKKAVEMTFRVNGYSLQGGMMSQDVIKVRVDRSSPADTKLLFYESRDGGEHWVHNGMLVCDKPIADTILNALSDLGSEYIIFEEMELERTE